MSRKEMPVFTRTYDLLSWLLPVSNHFPRAHRHSLTRRMLDMAFNLREQLECANMRRDAQRLEQLRKADESLACLQVYLRLAHRMQWLSTGQYRHVAEILVETGRLIGGWIKVSARPT